MTSLLPSGETYWFDFQGRKVGLELTMLDPMRAQDYLDNYNARNRRMSSASVIKYTRDIKDDLWFFTGETIIIGEDGNIHNGQNRCKAVVESGKSIPVLIVYNVSKEGMAAIDQNKPRNVRDILTTTGDTAGVDIPNDTVIGATARLLMLGNKDLAKYVDNRQRIALYVQGHFDALLEVAAWGRTIHQESPTLERSVINTAGKDRKAISPSAVAALSLVMEYRGGDKLDIRSFFEKVVGKIRADNDTEHRSMATIRMQLARNTPLSSAGSHKSDAMMNTMKMLIICYNRVQCGTPIKKIVFPQGDSPRWFDDLPKVEGRCSREDVI